MVLFLSQVLRLLSTVQVPDWRYIRQNDLATFDDIFRGELWQAGFIRHHPTASTAERRQTSSDSHAKLESWRSKIMRQDGSQLHG